MSTLNQLLKKARLKKKKLKKAPALEQSPQKRGVCIRVYTKTTKKTKLGNSKSCKGSFIKWF
jgi:small subunit ribosomal protein S12